MTNLLQENIEMKSPRTNSTFGFLPTHEQTQKNQKSYFRTCHTEKNEEQIVNW